MTPPRSIQKLVLIMALACFGGGCLSGCGGGGGGGGASGTPGTASDQSGVSITITHPDASEIDTSDEAMELQGTATSDAGVTSVSWKTSRGSAGAASGTSQWRTGAIPLELGRNVVTVSATDSQNGVASKTIEIRRDSGRRGSVTLTWTAPTQREDGTPLNDLAAYRIHYGRMSKIYDHSLRLDNPGILTYVVEDLSPGMWHFSLTAVDSDGLESDPSAEVRARVE